MPIEHQRAHASGPNWFLDRDVLFVDDCSGTFNWEVGGTGGDDVHTYATAAAYAGTHGIHLKTRTTGAAATDDVDILHPIEYPRGGLIEVQCMISPKKSAGQEYLDLAINALNPDNAYVPAIRVNWATSKLQYVDSLGAFIDISGALASGGISRWYRLGLIADVKQGKYIAAYYDGEQFDLSGIDAPDDGGDTRRDCDIQFRLEAHTSGPAEVYIDNIVARRMEEL